MERPSLTIAFNPDRIAGDGLVETKRSPLGLFAAILRNPLSALPPEIFRERLVLASVAGRQSLYEVGS